MYRNLLNSLFFILLHQIHSFGQDFEKELGSIINKLDSSLNVSIEVNVEMFDKKGGGKVYSSKAQLDKTPTCSITTIGPSTVYIGNRYLVEIDREEKTVLINKTEIKEGKGKSKKVNFNTEDLKKLIDEDSDAPKPTITLLTNQNGIKTYVLTKLKGYKEIKVVLDVLKECLIKVTYEYELTSEYKGTYIVIDYIKFNTKAVFDSNYFNENKYFTIKSNVYKLTEAFKNYKLIVSIP